MPIRRVDLDTCDHCAAGGPCAGISYRVEGVIFAIALCADCLAEALEAATFYNFRSSLAQYRAATDASLQLRAEADAKGIKRRWRPSTAERKYHDRNRDS